LVGYQNAKADQIPYLPRQVFSYFPFVLVTATRLFLLSDSDWNQAEARRVVDCFDLSQHLRDHLAQADSEAAAGPRKRKYTKGGRLFLCVSAEKLRWIG
jgi:hypothetical protein